MVEVIDAFGHAMPRDTIKEIFEMFPDNENFQRFEGEKGNFLWDVESHHIPDMNEFGVDRMVLALALPLTWKYEGMTAEKAFPVIQNANDGIRAMADDHPDRFIPVGTLPFVDDDYLAEFDRCIEELDMKGIQIFSNMSGKALDHEDIRPIFAKAEEHDVPIWIHPQFSEWLPYMEYIERAVFGFPFDTGIAVSRLIFGGVLDDHPDLKIIPHHCGGVLPHFDGRLASFFERPEHYQHDKDQIERPIEEYYERINADAVLNGSVHALECGIEAFGSDQIVFATDYPFGAANGREFMRENKESVEALDRSDRVKAQIFNENLRSLIDI